MTAIVTQGDAASLSLPGDTVDLVVTSPPYFGLRSYQDGGQHYAGQVGDEATPTEYLDALIACTREWMRVLKPGGSIFVNLGDKYSGAQQQNSGKQSSLSSAEYWQRTKPSATGIPAKSLMMLPQRYAIRCVDELGLILRAEVVWSKPNGMPESVTDRVRRSHEQVFHFVKQPRYYSAVDEVREAASYSRPQNYDRGQRDGLGKVRTFADAVNPLGKLPGSVWSIPTAPLSVPAHLGVDHFAAYPPELVRRIILGWSPRGGTILDPFGGTGTTALVASVHGRVGISVDLSADYCRLARWRTTDPSERARALNVPKPPPVPAAQLDLFGGPL